MLIGMAVRAVVFDIGGVLELTPDLGVRSLWAARLGLTEQEYADRSDAVWTGGSYGHLGLPDVHAGLVEAFGVDGATIDALLADVWTEYLGTPNTELIEYVRGLRPRYRTGILSNSFAGAREKEQEAYGFEDLVDDLVYSHEVGLAKPDPRIYALICERHGVAPDEMIFVDDTQRCVDAARAYGIDAIRYEIPAQTIAEIEARLVRTD
jgi:epoxide hydrolase-like predicted phosphatase